MQVEGQKRDLLGWNLKFGKQGHRRVARIPIDASAWAKTGQGYVLAHDSQYENPLFVPKFLANKKKEGWTWSNNVDLDNDGKLDTVIYDKEKQPIFWNGYNYVDNVSMLGREKFMQNPDNEKYEYMMSKYKYDMKSDYEKILTDIGKKCHNIILKYLESTNANDSDKKRAKRDLSTQFFKSFMKDVLLTSQYIKDNKITTIDNYIAELNNLAKGFASDELS